MRARSGFSATTPLVLYTGTFEAYQGLDLLFAAMALVAATAAGRAAAARRRQAGSGRTRTRGRASGRASTTSRSSRASGRPSEIPAYLLACDVLVSPRSRGTNTPLKIYQYLRSGKPIVATRLLTHTQVLSDDTAILTGASPQRIRRRHPRGDRRPGRAAERRTARPRRWPRPKYSYEAYLERTRRACGALDAGHVR